MGNQDGKCPDIYECRMGVDKVLRENLLLKERERKLVESLHGAHEILEEYHRKHGVPRGNRATRVALLRTSDVSQLKNDNSEKEK